MVLTALLPLHFIFKGKLSTNKAWFYAFSLSILATYAFTQEQEQYGLRMAWKPFLYWHLLFSTEKIEETGLFWNKEKAIARRQQHCFFYC